MSDFSFDDFNDVADLVGGLQRHRQIRQQAAHGAKLDRIADLLEGQHAESNRIANLPKCPECKSPVEWEARRCPSCKENLFWCPLPNVLIPIANNRAEQELLRVMNIFIKPVKQSHAQWTQLIDLLVKEIFASIRTIHDLCVTERSTVLELFGSVQKAINFASDPKKMSPSLTGAIWNGARIDTAKELKLPDLLTTTYTLSSRFEDLLNVSAEHAKNLLRICKCRDYEGRELLRDHAVGSKTVDFAIRLVRLQQEWFRFSPIAPSDLSSWASYYLMMIQHLNSVNQASSIQVFFESTKGLKCPKCETYNHFIKENFSRGERCISCDCVIRSKSSKTEKTLANRARARRYRVACPKCSTQKDISLTELGSRITCSKCATIFATKKP